MSPTTARASSSATRSSTSVSASARSRLTCTPSSSSSSTSLGDLGISGAGRLSRYPGVWIDPDGPEPKKICAVGVRIDRGRSMHGFALNVDPDLAMFGHIVPCGLSDLGVTSMADQGVKVAMDEVVEAIVRRAQRAAGCRRQDRAPGLVLVARSGAGGCSVLFHRGCPL